jgi:hypothetical protein
MKIAVVYVLAQGDHYRNLAMRFIDSYQSHPPEAEHETIVVCQGELPTEEVQYLFQTLQNCRFVVHDNSGYDIGAFQFAARNSEADMMVFFGSTAYLKCVGWLRRMSEAFQAHGDTLYGTMGHRGIPGTGIFPHIRTTGFWMSPALLRQYPRLIERPDQRYGFEHGESCLTTWVSSFGKIPWVVAYDGEYSWSMWDSIPNGYHQGDQSNLLSGDRMTAPPYYHIA